LLHAEGTLRQSSSRAALANLLVAALVVVWAIWALLQDGVQGDFVIALPLAVLYATAAFSVQRAGSRRWLAIATWTSLVCCGLMLLVGVGSLLTRPVDVACAVWSFILAAGFGYATYAGELGITAMPRNSG
jgi:hypothetical protein